ncbi:MAG: condensation domain-containing protein, partial [Exilibacterium sp.]
MAGSGVARGYLNHPELTAQRFVADPFTTHPGTLMYRTGDQVCWSREGKLHYKGRLDDQVKVRGFRIETGEIESALAAREEVRQCVVVVRKDLVGNARLVAYLVKHEELVKQEDSVKDENLVSSNNTESLRKYLQNLLPDYMVPSAYVVLAQLPMTPNGKVDRNALPAPEGKAFAQEDYIAPRTPIELALAKIWAELLGLRPEVVSLTADFFTLGGHSLLATTLANRIKQDLSTDIPIRSIFEHPRLAQIAQQVNEAQRKALQFPVIKSAGASAEVSPFSQLSYAQQRLWFLARLEGNSAHYNIPLAINLTGNLNDRALITALHRLVNRHQVLRTYFLEKDGIPYQGVRQSDQFIISKENLANDVDRQAICAAEALAPFNLNGGSLCRIRLLKINAIEHLLLVTMHHCISDAWSMGIFFRELTQLYQALDTHPSCDPAGLMPPLPFQYTDFVHWQRQWLSDGGLQQQKAYWLQQLQGLPELLDLPTDFPRPQEKTYNGACEPVHFPLTLQQQLIDFSLRQGVTLYMTMLSAITIVLSRYSHQTDIALGSPVANRNHPGVENLMGFFVNTLVLRSNVSGNPRFVDFLSQVRQTALDAYSHQDIPFEYLVEALRPRRAPAYSPLFQVMFALQNIPVQQHDIADVSLRPIENPNTAAKFDITINLAETATGLRGNVEYNTDLFLPATITGLIAQLQNLLQAIVTQPELPIAHLDFLSQTEKQRTENAGPQTVAHTSACECSVVALFAAQVVCTPDKPAVQIAHQQISYRDLAIRSQRLADYLMDYDLGEGAAVGVIVTSAIEYAVALLGILKAGGVCVPIAPASPTHCIEYIVRDAEIGLMLTQGAWEFLASVGVQQIDLDKLVNEMPQDNAPRGHIRNSRHSGCWYSIAAAQRGGQAASLMYAWDIGKPRVRVFTHLNITAALNTPILTEFAQGPVAFLSA